jgi:molybdenum cofactor cytidylyltransferase
VARSTHLFQRPKWPLRAQTWGQFILSSAICKTSATFDVGIVLLAAGNSTRMGSAKQLMNFNGKPLVRHAAEVACRCNCAPVIVVLGASEHDVRAVLRDLPLEMVVNDSWSEGIGTSIKTGLHALGNRAVCGVILALADQPFITAECLHGLAEQHARTQKPIVASRYSGTVGVPAFLSRQLFPKLHALEPDQGCKNILLDCSRESLLIDCPEAAIDIDSPADYVKATSLGLAQLS